ncbi:MAG: 4Fe-4S binding protein [Bacteroidetes bacterium]|nr:4Fe-4S binding protein [Bacteroidota bacterium]
MKRTIIHIDENLCNGCGLCIPHCPEGAIQLIDGKARLVNDSFCDGLGACIGSCPEGAITIVEREAEPYDEKTALENIIHKGPAILQAHLHHLQSHGKMDYLRIALDVLRDKHISHTQQPYHTSIHACSGSASLAFNEQPENKHRSENYNLPSALTHWPIQLHLISPMAPYFRNAELLLVADCCAYAYGNFHQRFLKGKKIAIACPKLDEGQDVYRTKLTALIDNAMVVSLTVITMEVPCCQGLLSLACSVQAQAQRRVPLMSIVLSRTGEILNEHSYE